MTVRSLTLLIALLMLVSLSGCGTDTKTTNDLGGSNFTANHFDATTTPSSIEGYVVKKDLSGNPNCLDCHKPDQSDVTIHRQWAESAHGGHILAVGVVPKASPWAYYNWDNSTDSPRTSPDPDRKSCQQCHTATGNANFMKAQTAGTAYNPVNNDFSHLEGWTATNKTSGQNELLYCWGCHSDVEAGTLHAPNTIGIKPGYNVNDAALQLPNLGSSNTCVGCHSGLGNIQSLMTSAPTGGIDPTVVLTASTIPKSTANATSTHYKNAAATIFHTETKVGYEFPDLSYIDPNNYLHKFSNCIACHMSGEKSHSFSAADKDSVTGAITAINAQQACNGCHSSLIPMNAKKLEESREGYEESLHILENELALDGYVFVNTFPYFYVGTTSGIDLFYRSPSSVVPTVYSAIAFDRNGDNVIDGLDWIDANVDNVIDAADLVKQPVTWAKQGDLGAGHNFNYLHHEPGAYAHNRFYAQRLIFDSIDWLDNAPMDGQITIGIDYPAARIWLNADPSGIATRP